MRNYVVKTHNALLLANILSLATVQHEFCEALSVSPNPTTVYKVVNETNDLGNIWGSEFLDSEEKYLLSWNISKTHDVIYFEVTAKTNGYVGFGISPTGGMAGADIFIAGVDSDGSVYYSDRHATGNSEPVIDEISDWEVTYGKETETYTKLRFHRKVDTCDDDDMKITNGTMRIIWAIGDSDTINYHNTNKGTKSINFFMTNKKEIDFEKYEALDFTVNMRMPAQHTAYWCTIHRAPVFTKKQHVVAIEPVLESLPALQHTHHFTLFRCLAPDDKDPEDFFEPWVDHPGDFCYDPANASFPLENCIGNMIYVWSKGGKGLVFPPDLGLPMPKNLGRREYYAIEIHYDNPEVLPNIEFKTGGRLYYTPKLRKEEVSILVIDQTTQAQLTVPPKSKDFVVAGHCSGECTKEFLPDEGVTFFNVLFHAHLGGRKMKLRHFRGNKELEWVDNEDYYDFNFQMNKRLSTYRKVERGDQFTMECTMNSMNAYKGGAIIGGLGTREEMCEAIVYYYPKQDFFYCGSTQNLDKHFDLLGVTKYEKKNHSAANWIPEYNVLQPENLAGDYWESISFKVNWTTELREKFQEGKRFGEQLSICAGTSRTHTFAVNYPERFDAYIPPDECKERYEREVGTLRSGVAGQQLSYSVLIMLTIFSATFKISYHF